MLLRTLCFDFVVEHPYDHILKTCLTIDLPKGASLVLLPLKHSFLILTAFSPALRAEKKEAVAQFAFNFVNDSLSSTILLMFKPKPIATAALYLAAKRNDCKLDWKTDLKVSDDMIQCKYCSGSLVYIVACLLANISPFHSQRPLRHHGQDFGDL